MACDAENLANICPAGDAEIVGIDVRVGQARDIEIRIADITTGISQDLVVKNLISERVAEYLDPYAINRRGIVVRNKIIPGRRGDGDDEGMY